MGAPMQDDNTQTTVDDTPETRLKHLTGFGAEGDRPTSITEPNGGGKFGPNGAALDFPGNTIVCHIDPKSDAYAALIRLQDGMKTGPFSNYFSFLPPSSFHMTVFEGVCLKDEAHRVWPRGIAHESDLSEITSAMLTRLDHTTAPSRISIKTSELFVSKGGVGVGVSGADPEMETRLRRQREIFRDHLQINPPGFEIYRFHISLAYLLEWLPLESARELTDFVDILYAEFMEKVPTIELGPPEFCNFNSMHHFEPVRFLDGSAVTSTSRQAPV